MTAVVGTISQSWTSADAAAVDYGLDTESGLSTGDARRLSQDLRVGQQVVTCDGQKGIVFRLLRDSQSHLVTRLVVLTRPPFGRELALPVEWVVDVTHNNLSLRIDADELDNLPAYSADEEISRDVGRAL